MDIYWIPSSIHQESIGFHQIYIFVIYSLDPGVGSSRGSLLDFIPDQINDPIRIQKKSRKKSLENSQCEKNRKLNRKKGVHPLFLVQFSVFFTTAISFFSTSLQRSHAFKIRSHTYRPGPFFASITDSKRSSGRSKKNFQPWSH